MTVEEALGFFAAIPMIKRKLQTLYDVGLGYIHLGQPATTLSGGEAQRIKLATELSRRATGRTSNHPPGSASKAGAAPGTSGGATPTPYAASNAVHVLHRRTQS